VFSKRRPKATDLVDLILSVIDKKWAEALHSDLLSTINSKIDVRETPARDRAVNVLNEHAVDE
jgi:hypothetical protein